MLTLRRNSNVKDGKDEKREGKRRRIKENKGMGLERCVL